MAFVFRLRRILTVTNPSPSLLHYHHHHRRLLSTCKSGDGDNSKNPSPSVLREVREAVKKLSVRERALHTPLRDLFSSLPPFKNNPITTAFTPPRPPFNSEEAAQPDSASDSDASRNLNSELEQLKLKALSFKQKKDSDRERLWDLKGSHNTFNEEVKKNLAEYSRVRAEHKRNLTLELPQTRVKMGMELEAVIARVARMNEMKVEELNLALELSNSRLDYLYDIVDNLKTMKNYLQREVWIELNEDLQKAIDVEVKDNAMLAEETNFHVVYYGQRVTNLLAIRDNEG